jgi:glyoxylase-like metal-dependent hydrolase (beta-lactamase superfamily II)
MMIKKSEGSINNFITAIGSMMYPSYIVQGGSKNLMIEAGINLVGPSYIKSVKEIFGDINKLDYIFVTHSHFDHLGSVPYMKRQIPQLEFGGSPVVGDILKKESVIKRMNQMSEHQRPLYEEITGDEDVHIEPVALDFSLKEGDQFDLGGIICEIYETPGHTRDSISFFLPEEGILFPGEAVGLPDLENIEKPYVIFLTSYEDYLNSIQKLKNLKPKMICFGHGFVITNDDVDIYLENSYENTFQFRKALEGYLEEADGDIKEAVKIILEKEYPDVKKGPIPQEENAYIANITVQLNLVAKMIGK